MNLKGRSLPIVAFVSLVSAVVWQPAEGGNIQRGRPVLPPGITIALTTDAAEVGADPERRVGLEARLMLGGQPYDAYAEVKFRLVEGNGKLANAKMTTNGGGLAVNNVVLPTPGKVVIEATCMAQSCRGELTLQVAEKKE